VTTQDASARALPVIVVVLVGLVVMVGLVAWSTSASDEDTASSELCASYDELVIAGEGIKGADPETSTAGQAVHLVDAYLDSVHELQRTADGRYTQQLDALDQAVTDVQRTLSSVQDDADYATWEPLVADDIETALDAAADVHSVVAPSCTKPDL
jgi:hypothetical protein